MAASSRFTVRVEGLKELGAVFRRAADAGLPAQLRLANLDAAAMVAEKARPNAPVGTSARDPHKGRLRANIRPTANQRGAFVKVGGAAVPYAGPIHWGWPKRNIRKQPFLTEALQGTTGEMMRLYESALARVIMEIEA